MLRMNRRYSNVEDTGVDEDKRTVVSAGMKIQLIFL